MTLNPFDWIRLAARNAFLKGIEEGMQLAAPPLDTVSLNGEQLEIPELPAIGSESAETLPAVRRKTR